MSCRLGVLGNFPRLAAGMLEEGREEERAINRLDNSEFVPMAEIPGRLAELDRSRTLVVYCHTGVRSAQVVRYLRQNGFERATNLRGGIDAWSREVDPTVVRY